MPDPEVCSQRSRTIAMERRNAALHATPIAWVGRDRAEDRASARCLVTGAHTSSVR
jgi:hypothetical protein